MPPPPLPARECLARSSSNNKLLAEQRTDVIGKEPSRPSAVRMAWHIASLFRLALVPREGNDGKMEYVYCVK
jgi:hypothetical protein